MNRRPASPPWFLLLLFALGLARAACGQLAITEVMSSTREIDSPSFRGAEYWELTNFGEQPIDLTGYGFRDSDPTEPLVRYPFTNLVIRGGESIIFFRVNDSMANAAQFRDWWGDSNLPPGLVCRAWLKPGLSGWEGDEVRLYNATNQLVDEVKFGRARIGRAYTYAPASGEFGVFSAAGEDGAVVAAVAGDVGSPGVTTGPVPVQILQSPLDEAVDAGASASFTVVVAGLPRPRFQWYARGEPIPHATGATLVITNAQPADAGAYHVAVSNGVSGAVSAAAMLTVNTNPAPPSVVRPPRDATLFSGQTARFEVAARGLPTPGYQWFAEGVALAGAVGPVLELPPATAAMSGHYSVRITNALGATNVSARLSVERRPDLRFTEVMAIPANELDNRHFDWFELANFDTNPVNLLGWRISDHAAFARTFTITNELTLAPGECAIFAERLNARLFENWWGADHLPANLKLVTYYSFGLSAGGDAIFLWNPAATDPYDYIASVSWAGATTGVTFECARIFCDPEGRCLDDLAADSSPGVRGAFRAVDGGDIGSPGYLANPPLRILAVRRSVPGEVSLTCRVVAGRTYRLYRTPTLAPPAWTPLEVQTATNNAVTLTDRVPEGGSAWFYQVEEVP